MTTSIVKEAAYILLHLTVFRLTCMCNVDPLTPHFYSKIGVYRGIHYFLIFALKHRLWLLVNEAVLTCTHNICFEQK